MCDRSTRGLVSIISGDTNETVEEAFDANAFVVLMAEIKAEIPQRVVMEVDEQEVLEVDEQGALVVDYSAVLGGPGTPLNPLDLTGVW